MRPSIGRPLPLAAFLAWTGQSIAAETLHIEVRETAGIRRFGYPIRLKLPDLALDAANARLRDAGKAVAAQFRQEDGGAGVVAGFQPELDAK
jgi:hypothetical protein